MSETNLPSVQLKSCIRRTNSLQSEPPITSGTLHVPSHADVPPVNSNNDNVAISLNNLHIMAPSGPTNPRSVSFQIAQPAINNNAPARVPVPSGADETWKLTRKHFSASVKATCRAEHLDYLATNNLTPPWSLGVESIPGYVRPIITELATIRLSQAQDSLRRLAAQLRLSAQTSMNLGNAHQMVLEQLYAGNNTDFNVSIARIQELVTRDQTECRSALQRRVDTLRANPMSTTTAQTFLLSLPNQSSATRAPEAHSSQDPQPSTSNSNPRSARPRGRGRGRGRPSPRGGASRGRGNNRGRNARRPRSRSNSRPRSTTSTQNPSSLSRDEMRVLLAFRSSKNN